MPCNKITLPHKDSRQSPWRKYDTTRLQPGKWQNSQSYSYNTSTIRIYSSPINTTQPYEYFTEIPCRGRGRRHVVISSAAKQSAQKLFRHDYRHITADSNVGRHANGRWAWAAAGPGCCPAKPTVLWGRPMTHSTGREPRPPSRSDLPPPPPCVWPRSVVTPFTQVTRNESLIRINSINGANRSHLYELPKSQLPSVSLIEFRCP